MILVLRGHTIGFAKFKSAFDWRLVSLNSTGVNGFLFVEYRNQMARWYTKAHAAIGNWLFLENMVV